MDLSYIAYLNYGRNWMNLSFHDQEALLPNIHCEGSTALIPC